MYNLIIYREFRLSRTIIETIQFKINTRNKIIFYRKKKSSSIISPRAAAYFIISIGNTLDIDILN